MTSRPDTAQHSGRALVIGAQGMLGSITAATFERAGWEVRRGGRRPGNDVDLVHVDLEEPETIAAALTGADVVINTVPDLELTTERMVLERGGVLLNVSAMPAAAARQLRNETGPQCGTVVMNAGIAPGITNLIAADLLGQHPEADEVELVFTVSTRSSIGPAGREFAHRGLTAVSRHRTTEVTLPQPFGRRRCLGFAEPERGWLGAFADGRAVNSYVCIAEPVRHAALLAINRTGLIGKLPAARPSRPTPDPDPDRSSTEPIAHWVCVRARGRRLDARTLRCNGDYRAAAASTVLFADALLHTEHGTRRAGVLDPDEAVTLAQLAPGLEQAGIRTCAERPAAAPIEAPRAPREVSPTHS